MAELGHVVFYVRDLERSIAFYRDIVGLEPLARIFSDKGIMFSGGQTHHELLLIESAAESGPLMGQRIGLYHTGWKVGDSIEVLKQVYQRVLDAGLDINGCSDHTVSQSLYLSDPDGNEVELYVDNPEVDWRNDKSWMDVPVKPLRL